ncbi:MAG: hypothetical protein KDA89_08050, partial [Planctomycetaceae bacterium]|nr:hypothetical protein [Planctomycetaceae bacterium]
MNLGVVLELHLRATVDDVSEGQPKTAEQDIFVFSETVDIGTKDVALFDPDGKCEPILRTAGLTVRPMTTLAELRSAEEKHIVVAEETAFTEWRGLSDELMLAAERGANVV